MRTFRIGLWFVIFAVALPLFSALDAAPVAVEVVSVRFTQRRLAGQSDPWLEAAIDLRAVRSGVCDVKVDFLMRFKNNLQTSGYSGVRTITCAGSAKLYALNRNALVRFYLPPDFLRVHNLSQSPEAWQVSLASSYGIEPLPLVSSSLASWNSPVPMSGANGTVPLLPHYDTPFYSISETQRDLPSYVIH